jgi:hypothetical protein
MAFLCVSQQGDFKNTTKHKLGEVHVKNFWPKSCRKKAFFLSYFPIDFFYLVFMRRPFLCMRSPKTPYTYFLKPRPNNLKKSQKKQVGRCVAFFSFFFWRLAVGRHPHPLPPSHHALPPLPKRATNHNHQNPPFGPPLIPIEQNPRALLLPVCLRGCFPVPADRLVS